MSLSLSVLERLAQSGYSVVDISNRFNVSRQSVYYSISCHPTGSRKIRLFISSILSIPPSVLFPDLSADVKLVDDSLFMSSLVASYKDGSKYEN